MLAAPPALFLHQEIRFPVTQTHESAFPLSIIHSQICNSRGFRGMEERKKGYKGLNRSPNRYIDSGFKQGNDRAD